MVAPAELPVVGITLGDPRGIGPEITRAALRELRGRARFVAYAPRGFYGPDTPVDAYRPPSGVGSLHGDVAPEVADAAARAAIELAAAELAAGAVDAVVTAPVRKACFGGEFPGHTELFAARLGVPEVAMLLWGPKLSVVPLTTHVALRDVPRAVTTARIVSQARIVHAALRRDFGLASPRLGLAALNPHAGDGGLFGDEEARVFVPAVERLRAEGVQVDGPLSPDTVYGAAVRGAYDVVLAPYHDQGLVPFKLLHFADGVNVTLGLPRPRTSPDHGPAYELAGTGRADPRSMVQATALAVRLAARRGA